jgi:tetratricopeptide (TPR) repeat protein
VLGRGHRTRVRAVEERGLVRQLSSELDRRHHLVVSQGMRRLGLQPLSSYRFRHNLFQKYLYDTLDAAEKAYLHQDVGNALEVLYGEEAEEIAVQLARHFQEAAIVGKAAAYLHQAGEQACRRYANEEAIAHFRQALALLAEAPPHASEQRAAAEIYEALGDVLVLIGQAEEARAAYEGALARAPLDDAVWRSRLQRRIGHTWERQRYYHQHALQAYDLAETTLGQEPTEPVMAWWQEWIAIQIDRIWTTYWSKGPWREMLGLAEKTRVAAQQYGTPAQRGSFYECLVLVENRRYRYVVPEETVTYAETSVAANQESGDLGQVARSQFLLGFCHLWRDELDKARGAIQAAQTLAERIGDVDVHLMCVTYLPVVYRKGGQVKEARHLLAQSLTEARERGSIEYEGMARATQAWVALREGNLAEAQESGQAALELWQPPVIVPFMSLALWPLIGVALAQDQIAEAIDYARALFGPEQQPLPDGLAAVVEGAITAWKEGESEQAGTHLNRARELAQELGYL